MAPDWYAPDLEKLICALDLKVNWYASIGVNGYFFQFLIDSGSPETFISVELFDTLDYSWNVLEPITRDFTVANGYKLDVVGRLRLKLCINDVCKEMVVNVAKLGTPVGILGLDALRDFDVVLYARDECISVAGKMVPIVKPNRKIVCCRISTQQSCVIPKRSEKLIWGSISCPWTENDCNVAAVVDPVGSFVSEFGARGVFLYSGIVNPDCAKVPLLLANLSEEDVVIPDSCLIGLMRPDDGGLMQMVSSINGEQEIMENLPTEVFQNSSGGELTPLPESLKAMLDDIEDITVDQREKVEELIREFQDVFTVPGGNLGRTDAIKHRIVTTKLEPVKVPPRRLGWAKWDAANKEIDKLLEQDVIEESNSPYNAPLILIPKKDGVSHRLVLDYRQLNSVTVKDAYSLPRIDDILDSLGGASWFSCLDLDSGFFQVEIEKADRYKTAFSLPGRNHFQFKVLPMGMSNSPALFERLMENILRDVLWKTTLVFVDDVMVYSNHFDRELENLRGVFSRIRRAGMKFKPKKCKLFRRQVEYLGHVISGDGVKCDEKKTAVVRDWPIPTKLKELQSFLGTATYYRKFVPSFASIASPLTDLMRKGVKFNWTVKCQTAFDELKRVLTTSPILSYPQRDGGTFILDTDCSGFAAGAVLSQLQDGQEKVIGYASKALNKEQKNYCATYRELFAVRWAVEHFRHYLWGRKFVLRTDHSSLRWLLNFKDPSGVVARWITYLSSFDYDVEHREGKKHGNADGLSRRYRRRCSRVECLNCNEHDSVSHAMVAPVIAGAHTVTNSIDRPSPAPNWLHTLSNEEWRDMQMADSDIGTVISLKKSASGKPSSEELLLHSHMVRVLCSHWKFLSFKNGVLCREYLQVNPGCDSTFQIVMPMSLRRKLFIEYHALRTGGHLGRDKTYAKLRDRFYWPGMKQDVSNWVKFCKPCTASKTGHGKKRAKLVKMLCSEPLDRISLDFVGPMPSTELGNKYLMVVTDYFSKWVEAYPMKNLLAASAADILVTEFFCKFGAPSIIHTDQGVQFESTLFQEMCELYEIFKTRTTTFRPQSDGLTERNNRSILQMLTSYVNESRSDWDVHLPYLLQAYRSSVHDSTGYSPNKLFLGREVSLPSDIVYGRPPKCTPYKCYTDYVEWFSAASVDAFKFAREKLRRSAVKQKTYFNRFIESLEFEVGSYVWFYYPPKHRKLSSGWNGPWQVIEKLENFVYRIKNIDTGKFRITHVDNLHPYIVEGEEDLPSQSPAESSNFETDDIPVASSNCEINVMPRRNRIRPAYLNDYITDFS